MGWEQSTEIFGADSFTVAAALFLRVLGLIYLTAFVSLAVQIPGLIGQRGILPAGDFLAARRYWGFSRFWRIPTLCWLGSSDRSLLAQAWGGAFLALLLVLGLAPMLLLVMLWALYLSLFNVGRIFLGYQWDILLLETGFLAIFLGPFEWLASFPMEASPSPIILWLFWWLLFRLMFSSGVVKFRSGDRSWRNLTALCRHYETQPLPTPVAWNAHQLPRRFHKLSTALVLIIELLLPFLIFAPPPFRTVACFCFMGLMVLIQVTGNYCFFNLLGFALCILLLDDRFWLSIWSSLRHSFETPLPVPLSSTAFTWLDMTVAVLILFLSFVAMLRLARIDLSWTGLLGAIYEFLDRFRLVNSYGLFSVMTTERPEIQVEGSIDGVEWRAYEFKWKPGEVKRAPRFAAPHQPRLDWQMWFAALGYYANNPWFHRFLLRLLEGSPPVLRLLKTNPFPKSPPRFVRGILYDYRFTDPATRSRTGAWWRVEQRGQYCPAIQLGDVLEE